MVKYTSLVWNKHSNNNTAIYSKYAKSYFVPPGPGPVTPPEPFTVAGSEGGVDDAVLEGIIMSRHLRTKSLALFAKDSLSVFRRNSFMCLPSRVDWNKNLKKEIYYAYCMYFF